MLATRHRMASLLSLPVRQPTLRRPTHGVNGQYDDHCIEDVPSDIYGDVGLTQAAWGVGTLGLERMYDMLNLPSVTGVIVAY